MPVTTLEDLKSRVKKSTAAAILDDNKPVLPEQREPQREEVNTEKADKLADAFSGKLFEEEFTRQTFYVRKDLLKKIDKLAKSKKGVKTRIINTALENFLNTVG